MLTPPTPRRRRTDRARIRHVFLRARPWYGLGEAAEVLAMTEDQVKEAIEDGVIDAVDFEGDPRIAWQELVVLGVLYRWTPRLIATAVPRQHVPPLARSVRKPIDLPHYLWELLALVTTERTVAEERELTVSDIIEEAIHHALLDKTPRALEQRLPGIRLAAAWPLIWDV
jgi:hypothetical protein